MGTRYVLYYVFRILTLSFPLFRSGFGAMRSFKFDPDLETEFQTATAPEGGGDFSGGDRPSVSKNSFTRDRHGAKGFSVVPAGWWRK